MTDRYLLYSRHGHRTGQRLAEYLGVPHGRDPPGERQDHLLRWGTSQSVGYIPEIQTWNLKRAIENTTDKYNALRMLDERGIPVPPYSRDPSVLEYPMLGRREQHARGNDINLVLQEQDIYESEAEYYVQYVPTKYEFRVHVINGDIVRVAQKVPEGEGEYEPHIRNHETGWIFVNPRVDCPQKYVAMGAVEALDLHFGAVDMIIGEDGDAYILEVNTAPSLNDTNLEIYGDEFAEMLELEEYPGMDAVDWSDREDVTTDE